MKLSVAVTVIGATVLAGVADLSQARLGSFSSESISTLVEEQNLDSIVEVENGEELNTGRILTMGHSIYSPLQCNIDATPSISSDDCLSNSVSLSSLVDAAAAAMSSEPVTVPCGTCCHVDYTEGSTINLPHGLNVLGRLHFPPSANVVLNTTSVIVQGHLDIGIPTVGNKVKISLYGTDEQFFYPHEHCCTGEMHAMDSNTRHLEGTCDLNCEHKRSMGKKPIVVAGGTIDIQAVDPTCPAWTTLKDVSQIPDPDGTSAMYNKNFVVDPDFARCVRPDDDLIITSDYRGQWDNHFQWTAESVDATNGVISMKEHTSRQFATEAGPGEAIFAAEVASLRRDVIFEGQKDDSDDKHGAHFMIFHTPDVVQTITGVHFENFGQAGNIGRYPIHFHMCGPSPSLVSKNVIRNSNQRCVVIHDSNNVTIDDNVAYNTRGHCYATETGSEIDNTFTHNLGAQTYGLGANNGQSDSCCDGHPHHNEPSTFWIRNAQNHFIGNVAAGAAVNGWWFEMKGKLDSPLYTFRHNAAHSCRQGLITYPGGGWMPSNDAVLQNLRIYKNGNDGFKFIFSGGFTIKDSVIADNAYGIRTLFNGAHIKVINTKFIAQSEDARSRLGWNCDSNTPSSTGLRYSFETSNQIQLQNVTFSKFCRGNRAIGPYFDGRFGGKAKFGDPLSTVEVVFDDSVVGDSRDPLPRLNEAWTNYMEDVNGTMSPKEKGSGFFIQDTDRMKAFVQQCSPINSQNSHTLFCESACLRHVEIIPQNYISSAYKSLILSNGSASFEYSSEDSSTGNHFDVLLPPGEYSGHFRDEFGTEIVPQSVDVVKSRPPENEGCDDQTSYVSFDTSDDPPPEVQFYSYAANMWLYASSDNSAGWYGHRGTRADEDPIDDTAWKVETVACPATISTFNRPSGVACYQLIGGGSSRRKLFAETNSVWTQRVGVKQGPFVGMDDRWYFEKTHCSDSDPRDCFFIINAYNGRRLYRTGNKPDFGGTPSGTSYTSDMCKWYISDFGTSTLSSVSALEYVTSAPTATPTVAPTISAAPTRTAPAEVQLINYEAPDKYLFAGSYTGDAYAGRGSRASLEPSIDTIWKLEGTECPLPISAFESSRPTGIVCYQLVGGSSGRRMFASTNRIWTQATGARVGDDTWETEKWYFEKATCDPTEPMDCFYIINAKNGRRLFKSPNKWDFGATPQAPYVLTAGWVKWYMKDLGTSTPISALEYVTSAPTATPTVAPTISAAPTRTAPAEVQLINYEAPDKYLFAGSYTGDAYAGRGSRASLEPSIDTMWKLEGTECPLPISAFESSRPNGIVCYQLVGGSSGRRMFASTNRIWTQATGARVGDDTWETEKWYFEKATCDPTEPMDCFYIINAKNGRRLFKSPNKWDFGATPQAPYVLTAGWVKWYMKDLGTSTPISALEYVTSAPTASPNIA